MRQIIRKRFTSEHQQRTCLECPNHFNDYVSSLIFRSCMREFKFHLQLMIYTNLLIVIYEYRLFLFQCSDAFFRIP